MLWGLLGPGKRARAEILRDFPLERSPRLAVIIDDIGYSRSLAKRFWDLQVPLTFAVLPRLEKSRDLAEEIHARGHEIMLHQPMEPHERDRDPGPGAVYVGFEEERIREVLEENLAVVPFASGVNNHMGSRFTERRREMEAVLDVVGRRSLYFVDSLTSAQSVAFQEAQNRRMPTACRNLFLDGWRNEDFILRQLFLLERHAYRCGWAVGIGHPYPETVQALARYLRAPHQPGRFFVHMSVILSL